MASSNVETYRAAHDAFNRRDFDAVIGHLTDSFTYTDAPRGVTHDKQEFRASFLQGWVDAFSDARVTEREYIDGGDVVVCRFVGRGTNDGTVEGAPPTHRTLNLPFVEIMRFDGDGRITGGEAIYDQVTLLVQLGLMPAPTAVQ
jgi:steroid delta-isomerase-like uncharacterized protein